MEKSVFLEKFGISSTEFDRTGLNWQELDQIKQNHMQNRDRLEAAGRYVADRLRTLPEVHTVRSRIKDSVSKTLPRYENVADAFNLRNAKTLPDDVTDFGNQQ